MRRMLSDATSFHEKQPFTLRTVPSFWKCSLIRAVRKWWVHMTPSMNCTLFCWQAFTISWASSRVGANGFSQLPQRQSDRRHGRESTYRTCLPLWAAAMVYLACNDVGSGIYTASTSLSSNSSSYEPYARSMPCSFAHPDNATLQGCRLRDLTKYLAPSQESGWPQRADAR